MLSYMSPVCLISHTSYLFFVCGAVATAPTVRCPHRHHHLPPWVEPYSRGSRVCQWRRMGNTTGCNPAMELDWRLARDTEVRGHRDTWERQQWCADKSHIPSEWPSHCKGGVWYAEQHHFLPRTDKNIIIQFVSKLLSNLFCTCPDSPGCYHPKPHPGSPAGVALSPEHLVAGSSRRWTDWPRWKMA